MVSIAVSKTVDKGSSPLTPAKIEVWCNGSTRDFGSLSLGSNPGTSTIMRLWASGRNHWSAKPIIHRWFESNQALNVF